MPADFDRDVESGRGGRTRNHRWPGWWKARPIKSASFGPCRGRTHTIGSPTPVDKVGITAGPGGGRRGRSSRPASGPAVVAPTPSGHRHLTKVSSSGPNSTPLAGGEDRARDRTNAPSAADTRKLAGSQRCLVAARTAPRWPAARIGPGTEQTRRVRPTPTEASSPSRVVRWIAGRSGGRCCAGTTQPTALSRRSRSGPRRRPRPGSCAGSPAGRAGGAVLGPLNRPRYHGWPMALEALRAARERGGTARPTNRRRPAGRDRGAHRHRAGRWRSRRCGPPVSGGELLGQQTVDDQPGGIVEPRPPAEAPAAGSPPSRPPSAATSVRRRPQRPQSEGTNCSAAGRGPGSW